MPRRARVVHRPVMPDPVYGNRHAGKFINNLMYSGKKSLSERIFYAAMDIVGDRSRRSAIEVFEQAMRNATPVLEVKPEEWVGQPIRCR